MGHYFSKKKVCIADSKESIAQITQDLLEIFRKEGDSREKSVPITKLCKKCTSPLLLYLYDVAESINALRYPSIEGELRRNRQLRPHDLVKIFSRTLQPDPDWPRFIAVLSALKIVFNCDSVIRQDLSFGFELLYAFERGGYFRALEEKCRGKGRVCAFIPTTTCSQLSVAYLALLTEFHSHY